MGIKISTERRIPQRYNNTYSTSDVKSPGQTRMRVVGSHESFLQLPSTNIISDLTRPQLSLLSRNKILIGDKRDDWGRVRSRTKRKRVVDDSQEKTEQFQIRYERTRDVESR